jgi:hypothetical protein
MYRLDGETVQMDGWALLVLLKVSIKICALVTFASIGKVLLSLGNNELNLASSEIIRTSRSVVRTAT